MNVVFIFVDQHNPAFTGCYGGITRTPNIDSLAENGVKFRNAYSTCPICVPARASMWTGRYVHEIGTWDNALPYDGKVAGWGHYLTGKGVNVTTVGKLDFKPDCDFGITEQILPRHRGSLDITSLYRTQKPVPRYSHLKNHWAAAPRSNNETSAVQIEEEISAEAIEWLRNKRSCGKPWVLNINYCKPHPYWNPRKDLFEYYRGMIDKLPDKYYQKFDDLNEPEQAQSVHTCGYSKADELIKDIHAAYHASVEEVDEHVGRILQGLSELGIRDEVLVVYAADHGEMARAHGTWAKSTLYEDSAKVPMIMSGPGVPKGQVVDKPVTLLNVFPTISKALGVEKTSFSMAEPLLDFKGAVDQENLPEYIFAESHANGRLTGSYIIRKDEWKLFWYVGYEPMLFNLNYDPDEMHDLLKEKTDDENVQDRFNELKMLLYKTCSPEGADQAARRDQLSLRKELAQTGQLLDELEKRGFKRNENKLEPIDC